MFTTLHIKQSSLSAAGARGPEHKCGALASACHDIHKLRGVHVEGDLLRGQIFARTDRLLELGNLLGRLRNRADVHDGLPQFRHHVFDVVKHLSLLLISQRREDEVAEQRTDKTILDGQSKRVGELRHKPLHCLGGEGHCCWVGKRKRFRFSDFCPWSNGEI